MIYGLNFNGTPIPPDIKRKFSARLRTTGHVPNITGPNWPDPRFRFAFLQGVCTDGRDLAAMLDQVNNGRRTIFTIERRTAGAPFYGVYTW